MAKGKRKNAFRKDVTPASANLQAADRGTAEFQRKHDLERVKTDQDCYAARVKDKRPIDKYHRLYCIDLERGIGEMYRRGINEEQFRAGDRFSCNYERTSHTLCKPLDNIRVQTSVNVAMYPMESIMNAIHQHTRVLKELGRGSQDILQEICCQEKTLMEYEARKGWRKGYGMIRLCEALEELAAVFQSLGRQRRDR